MKIFSLILVFFLLLISETVIAQAPVANFTANVVAGCSPLPVYFTNTSTGGGTYQWNLGNGVTSTMSNASTTYTTPGTYTVTLTVTNANGTNTKTVQNFITVYSNPVVSFTANDTAGCPPHTVNFTNSSTPGTPGAMTYLWVFGDGTPFSTQANPSHTYTASGYYPVTLTATDVNGCSTTLPVPNYIHVYTPPMIDFTATNTVCTAPGSVNFTTSINGTPPYVYQWDFGDGGNGSGAAPSHVYSNPGSYTVRLIVTDGNGCKDTLYKSNYVNVGNLLPDFTATAACAGADVQFVNTSGIVDSLRWYFGDGGTDTGQAPRHAYTTSGTFNATLIVYKGSCIDSIIKPVSVHPSPNVGFSFNPLEPCPPPTIVNFANNSNASSYLWDFGDGNTSTQTSPAHTFTTDSFFVVKLVATSAQGCADSVVDTVKVYVARLEIPDTSGCTPMTVQFRDTLRTRNVFSKMWFPPIYYYPYAITSHAWNLGNGNTSTSPTPSTTYTTIGNHIVTLTVTTANGCTLTDSIQVSNGNKPTAAFTIVDDSVCVNAADTFINLSTGPSPLTFLWDFGAGLVPIFGTPVVHHFSSLGTFGVGLVASHYGCNDTFIIPNAVTTLPPGANFTPWFDCDSPLVVKFEDSAIATSRFWTFGDGTSDTIADPRHTFPSLGSYTVTLIAENSDFGCIDTLDAVIPLFDPALTISTPDTAICRGDSIAFTPNFFGYTGQYPQIYIWGIDSFKYCCNSFTSVFKCCDDTTYGAPWGYRFDTNGVYTVWMKTIYYKWYAPLQECWDSVSKTIVVGKPNADFIASPTLGCNPLNVSFTDNSTNTSGVIQTTREWDFGNGTLTTPGANASQLYTSAGLYNVQLIVTDNIGCSDTIIKPAYIDVRDPDADFTVSDTIACMKELIAFNNKTSGSQQFSSLWDFGDGTTDTVKNPIHSYAQTGNYTVRLIVTDQVGCKDTIEKMAYIHITKPDASFTVSDSVAICPPLNIIFTNLSSGATNYAWNFGDGTSSTLQNPTASYTTPGIYNIRLIAISPEQCKDTVYKQVQVLGYAGGLTYTPLDGCVPLTVKFKSQLFNVPSIIWDFSDGVIQPANGIDSATHTYTNPGAYVPKLILSDNTGCQNSSLGIDTIKVDAVVPGFLTSPPCVNTPVTFMDTTFSYFSPVTKWYWSINNGQYNFSAETPSVVFSATGTYPVKLVATNAHGCTDSMEGEVTIYDLPVMQAVSDTSVCAGDAAQLSAAGGASYTWVPGATLSCTNCSNPSAYPTEPTSYIVTGTDARGCAANDTVNVNIQFITTSVVAPGGEICKDSSFQLNASGAQRYEWKPAETLNDYEIANPVATPESTTVYLVTAWEGSCLPDTHSVRIVVLPKPIVDAGSNVTIVAGHSVMLTATGSNFKTLLWSPAATLSCESCSNPYATPRATTQYKVIATSENGCTAFDTVVVRLLCDQSQLFIPNTFSPNGDGENDVFYPRGAGLDEVRSFRVYNRWGEPVFERKNVQLNDAAAGWDGTYKGRAQPPDVFVYVVDGICDDGQPISWKGDVTLIR